MARPGSAAGVPDAAERLRALRGRARPVALAGERVLPVLPALTGLLPGGGLRRGSTVVVGAGAAAGVGVGVGGGATSLALALVAGASAAGSWCCAVGPGASTLGVLAAASYGVVLERFPLVSSPPQGEWPTITAALLDAFDVVLAWPPPVRLRTGDVRRLTARARERGAVLVVVGGAVEGADTRLTVVSSSWEGLVRGHGHLAGRVVEVVGGGRGAASRERRARLWLPAPDGGGVVPFVDDEGEQVVPLVVREAG